MVFPTNLEPAEFRRSRFPALVGFGIFVQFHVGGHIVMLVTIFGIHAVHKARNCTQGLCRTNQVRALFGAVSAVKGRSPFKYDRLRISSICSRRVGKCRAE